MKADLKAQEIVLCARVLASKDPVIAAACIKELASLSADRIIRITESIGFDENIFFREVWNQLKERKNPKS